MADQNDGPQLCGAKTREGFACQLPAPCRHHGQKDATAAKKPSGKAERGIYQRGSVWYILWYDHDGQRHREAVGTKTQAKQLYQKRRTEVKEGKLFPSSMRKKRAVTVKDVLQAYLEATTRNATHKGDLLWARWLNSSFGSRAAESLKTDELTRWLVSKAEGKSPASGNRPMQLLRRACTRAVENGLLTDDPTARVKMLKESAGRDRHLRLTEETDLRRALPGEWWPIVELAYQTGLRQDEEFSLEWTQVDFENAVIKLGEAKGDLLAQGVALKAEYVHLNSRALEILRSLPSRLKSRWVFPNLTGTSYVDAHNFMERIFRPALDAAGIHDFHFHDLRHTYGSRLAIAGVPLYEIMRLMRHRSIRMTERYAHLVKEKLTGAVERLVGYQEPQGVSKGSMESNIDGVG